MTKCRFVSSALVICLLLMSFCISGNIIAVADNGENIFNNAVSYADYSKEHKNTDKPRQSYELKVSEAISCSKGATLTTVDQKECVLLENSSDWLEWELEITESGSYQIAVEYQAAPSATSDILFALKVNGEVPFSEAASLTLPLVWCDERGKEVSANSDETRPVQKQIPLWQEKFLSDVTGLYSDTYSVNLQKGSNNLCLSLNKESVYISKIIIKNEDKLPLYNQYISGFSDTEKVKGETYRIEAENAEYKSSSMLYPTYDRTSAATKPNDPVYVRLNTIGAGTWTLVGQSITWLANVPKSGLYRLSFRVRQDTKQGLSSYRTLYINGRIPFEEAKVIDFPYNDGWYNKTFGDEKDYYVYLQKGDTITLECTSGPTSTILQSLKSTVLELNAIYRKIIQITGTEPDIYRDYSLTAQIPELLSNLECRKEMISQVYSELLSIAGQDGAQASVMNKMVQTIQHMISEPNTIAERLSTFAEDIQSLGSLINDLGSQPLEMDCIACLTEDGEMPAVHVGFAEWLKFSVNKFLASFTTDYMSLGEDAGDSINVWISTGRDQANVISDVIKDMYTSASGVSVNLALVDTGTTLIRAVLAGKGPDSAIMIPMASPINLAMRGALIDLKSLGLTQDFMKEFSTSAWAPFEYRGGIYAIPESQYYDMLIYRKDIFSEYGLAVPDTWSDFYETMRIVQNNNLVVGVPEGQNTFNYFLFQNNGKYYNDNLDETLFDTQVAYSAFEQWTQLYSKYSLNRSLDFFNRFRSGEMPFGITSFAICNQIYSAAPELNGLWAMAPIPGTEDAQGNVNRSQASALTSAIVINTGKGEKSYKKAFDFVMWWTGCEAQTRYARDIESSMGIAARYAPANLKAFANVDWSTEDKLALNEQLKWLYNNPEIPGNYIISRCITNAFRTVVDEGKNARRQLAIYNRDINEEIKRKLNEFNPDTGE